VKQKNINILDEKDHKAVGIFANLGMPKNLAKTLLYIYQVDECRSADIEHAADLRQPEVSIAMQELRRRGWIKKRDLKSKGKGRPVHIYKSSMQLSKIINDFEHEKLKEYENVKKDLSELKNIVKTR